MRTFTNFLIFLSLCFAVGTINHFLFNVVNLNQDFWIVLSGLILSGAITFCMIGLSTIIIVGLVFVYFLLTERDPKK